MLCVSTHALERFTGRCRQWVPDGDRRAQRRYIQEVVEDGRMGTALEARCLSLWIMRAKRWTAPARYRLAPENVIVNDECGVMFVVSLDPERPTVTTAVLVAAIQRFARGLKGSKLKREATA
jgi:hypothetical protein